MVLDPLAKVALRMLMAVRIGRGQLMVHILRDRQRGEGQ